MHHCFLCLLNFIVLSTHTRLAINGFRHILACEINILKLTIYYSFIIHMHNTSQWQCMGNDTSALRRMFLCYDAIMDVKL